MKIRQPQIIRKDWLNFLGFIGFGQAEGHIFGALESGIDLGN